MDLLERLTMSDQLALWGEARARHDDPEPSRVAAEALKPNHQARLVRIAEIVDQAGQWGAIADEVHAVLCLEDEAYWRPRRSTVHGRVSNAKDAGLIVARGPKHVRMSVLNAVQTVYVTPKHQGETNA